MSRVGLPAGDMIPMAFVCGLVLAGAVLSFLTLWRAQALLRAARRNAADQNPRMESAIGVLQQGLEALQSQLQESRHYAPAFVVPATPRAGLNLDKRSQALRMHRRGEAPAQIAAALELPRQEVELLLKVHRIVLRSI